MGLRKVCVVPLPISVEGTEAIADGVELIDGADGGMVFLSGMGAWCWGGGDVVARRLAAVSLANAGYASHGEVADGFGLSRSTLWRWRRDYDIGGIAALGMKAKGPKGPSALLAQVVEQIVRLRATGASLAAVGAEVGLTAGTVRRGLAMAAGGSAPQGPAGSGGAGGAGVEVVAPPGELMALARPEPRPKERQAARRGELAGAAVKLTEGRGLALAGTLILAPALGATGLVDSFVEVYGDARPAFYDLRAICWTLIAAMAAGEGRAEGLTRIDPVDVGRLLGLDRAPEVKTIRRRMADLARAGGAEGVLAALARRHLAARPEATGVFYVDGHVRAYHGGAEVPKAHVARIRLAMGAEVDTWVGDSRGDGVLVWSSVPGASLVAELREALIRIRALVGPTARPTVVFDRGGWSPAAFADIVAAGFDLLTYRKGPADPEAPDAFSACHLDVDGRGYDFDLADRAVEIGYGDGEVLVARQVTRRRPSGHQTAVVTTRTDLSPAAVAHMMFSRWRQENFFRYLRAHLGLDALDAYGAIPDDLARSVPNPKKLAAAESNRAARGRVSSAEAELGRSVEAGGTDIEIYAALANLDEARARAAASGDAGRMVPARARLGDVRPGAQRLISERKRLHDAVRMSFYNAESATARLLAPHYSRAEDEGRSLLREAYRSPGDLRIARNQLHVTVNALSAPRRSRALAELCRELNDTATPYPGTDLTLVYAVHGQKTSRSL